MRQQEALHARQEAREEALARVADAACLALFRAAPILSARRRIWFGQAVVLAFCGAAIGYAAWRFPLATAASAHALGYAAFSALTVWRLFAAAAAMAPRATPKGAWTDDLPIYTVLCPLYREAHMMERLGARLGRIDYPGLMHQGSKVTPYQCAGPLQHGVCNARDYRAVGAIQSSH